MGSQLTISRIARATGVPARTIRFYEAEGALPAAARTAAGYRVYGDADVRRLRLLRHARMLGMTLPEAAELVRQALASDCSTFAPELARRIAAKRADLRRRIASLLALHEELVVLEQHVTHAECATTEGRRVAECDLCPSISDEGT